MQGQLRPQTFNDLVGQDRAKELLELRVKAFQKTKEASGHMLFLGGAGLGKTTLAMVIAKEMQVDCHIIMGTRIEKWNDILEIIHKIKKNDIVFIDEIHALPKKLQEDFYQLMEDFICITTLKYRGGIVENRVTKIPHFTLIGATTHAGSLSAPLRRRFQLAINLDDYTIDNLITIIKKAADRMYDINNVKNNVCLFIANISKNNAGNAINYLRNLMEIAEATTYGMVKSENLTPELLERLIKLQNIDPILGLNCVARKYLTILINSNKTIGIKALANMLNEQIETIEMEETFLMSNINRSIFGIKGNIYELSGPLVKLTKSGREATQYAKNYLKYCKELQINGWFTGEIFPENF